MKHISEFLLPKMERMGQRRTLTLFGTPREKGSGEWRAYAAVKGDIVHAYQVRPPKKAIVVTQAKHTLRIQYPHMRPVPKM